MRTTTEKVTHFKVHFHCSFCDYSASKEEVELHEWNHLVPRKYCDTLRRLLYKFKNYDHALEVVSKFKEPDHDFIEDYFYEANLELDWYGLNDSNKFVSAKSLYDAKISDIKEACEDLYNSKSEETSV